MNTATMLCFAQHHELSTDLLRVTTVMVLIGEEVGLSGGKVVKAHGAGSTPMASTDGADVGIELVGDKLVGFVVGENVGRVVGGKIVAGGRLVGFSVTITSSAATSIDVQKFVSPESSDPTMHPGTKILLTVLIL